MVGPSARSSTSLPGHADLFEDGNHLRCVPPTLAGRDDEPERAAPAFSREVDLACEPASRASQGLVGTVACGAPASTWDLRGAGGGASRVLMSAAGRGIDTDHAPVDPALGIGVGLDGPQDSLPRSVCRPASMTVVDCLPATGAGRQIPPGEAGPLPEQNPVDHPAVAFPASSPPAIRWQVRLQASPLLIRRISPPHAPPTGRWMPQCCGSSRTTSMW